MEFAKVQFELDGYTGTLVSFTKSGQAVSQPMAHWTSVQYLCENRRVISLPAVTSKQRWAKAALLALINQRLIWGVAIKQHRPWWMYDFDCVLEALTKSKALMENTKPGFAPSALITHVLIWTKAELTRYDAPLVHYPAAYQRSPKCAVQQLLLVAPQDLPRLIDARYHQAADFAVCTPSEATDALFTLWPAAGARHRDIQIAKQSLLEGRRTQDLATEYGITTSRICQLRQRALRKLHRLIAGKMFISAANQQLLHMAGDVLKSNTPRYHDEHNLGAFNYLQEKP